MVVWEGVEVKLKQPFLILLTFSSFTQAYSLEITLFSRLWCRTLFFDAPLTPLGSTGKTQQHWSCKYIHLTFIKETLYCQNSERNPVKQTTYLELDDQLTCVLMHLRAYLLFYLQNEKGGRGGELDSSKPAVPSQWDRRQLGAHYS